MNNQIEFTSDAMNMNNRDRNIFPLLRLPLFNNAALTMNKAFL
jgi:hypothetical protein